MKCVDEDEFGDDHGRTLEVHSLPAIVFQCFDIEQRRVNKGRYLGHCPLEIREEWGIVQRPF